jgi:hypothetical protein
MSKVIEIGLYTATYICSIWNSATSILLPSAAFISSVHIARNHPVTYQKPANNFHSHCCDVLWVLLAVVTNRAVRWVTLRLGGKCRPHVPPKYRPTFKQSNGVKSKKAEITIHITCLSDMAYEFRTSLLLLNSSRMKTLFQLQWS